MDLLQSPPMEAEAPSMHSWPTDRGRSGTLFAGCQVFRRRPHPVQMGLGDQAEQQS